MKTCTSPNFNAHPQMYEPVLYQSPEVFVAVSLLTQNKREKE
jgi:hypothetical protein